MTHKDDLLRAAIACDQLGAVDLGARLRKAAEKCVMVPMEPTEAMLEAGDDLLDDTVECAHNVWHAMLAAAPEVK